MKNLMSAFVDSYEDLTLLIEKKGKYKGKNFYLYNGYSILIYKNTKSVQYQCKITRIVFGGLKVHCSCFVYFAQSDQVLRCGFKFSTHSFIVFSYKQSLITKLLTRATGWRERECRAPE